jgi:hypothetical protein
MNLTGDPGFRGLQPLEISLSHAYEAVRREDGRGELIALSRSIPAPIGAVLCLDPPAFTGQIATAASLCDHTLELVRAHGVE